MTVEVFWLGIAMIAYDALIHLGILIMGRQWWIDRGLVFWPAFDKKAYEAFWAIYFSVAITLLIIGR